MEPRDDQKPTDQPGTFAKSNSTSPSASGSGKDSFQVTAPSIALSKGGGAIRGMGEKFAANPVTGTGSMSVPIATSPGRSGFGPQLSLSYDSGAGNGPFGFGWSLSLPAITRKTDKGLPKYQDDDDSDVFLLSGSEDLVPLLINRNGKLERETLNQRRVGGNTYQIQRYRPRIESLFARIERWSNQSDPTDVCWRSISKDNVTTWYGKTVESRIIDPANPYHIFCWLICQSCDDKGNVIVYGYKPENSKNVMVVQAHERNRTDQSRSAQRYLKRIRYGNRSPYLPELKESEPWPEPPGASAEDGSPHWLFEVVFDYDEPHYEEKSPDAEQRVFAMASPREPSASAWPVRPDPFSTYRAGFEVRTYRICQRVLMFHHFPGEENGGKDCLVRSTEFAYEFETDRVNARVPIYSFLQSVTQSGYLRQGELYLKKSLPPVEFTYSKPEVQDRVEVVDPESVKYLPIGLDGTTYQWTDLHGEGIPGILTEQGGAWFYKRNWSAIPDKIPDGSEVVRAKFSALETVALKPSIGLSSGAQFMDLAGDGQPDFVTLDGSTPGFYEHDEAEGWKPFQPFTARLNRATRDPNLKFVDLDGDGHADVLITEDDAFVWHPSEAEEGFGPARRVAQSRDEEKGPRLVFADGTQSIYLADLSGDGLTDLVRIRNGEACYWPNLGYGRFGAKVTMDHSPQFDRPDLFDQKRIRLADIDGSGTTDIIYLHRDGVRLYFNQSGNSWSQPRILNVFPHIDDLTAMVPIDLLGTGTACLVWSSPLSSNARRPMRYVNLMGERKPHLLVKTVNNLGAETRVQYAPSTKFYLQDKQNGTPWITKLPFPVHVVGRVETYDHIARNRFITRYSYHHGYFDGEEREFRGFGRVDQLDTEEFASLSQAGDLPVGENVDQTSHVPPVLTKTWFHTGAYFERQRFEALMAREYYQGDTQASLLTDTIFPDQLLPDEAREACRALKGSMLRQEVYARDRTNKADHPYTVAEQNMTVVRLQPPGSNRHAVFFTHAREALTYHYERNPADPRIQHALTLEVDDYGNVLKQAAIGYGRRTSPLSERWDRDRQTTALLTYTENRVTNAIASDDAYRNPLPCEGVTFELTGYSPTGVADRYQASDFVEPDPARPGRLRHKFTDQISYEATATGHPCRRPIEWLRTLYRPNDLGRTQNAPLRLLPLEMMESLALPGESYKLAFTPGLLDQVFIRDGQKLLPNPAEVLAGGGADHGGYVDLENNGHWWLPSGRIFYSTGSNDSPTVELGEAQAHFFLPRRYRDPFHTNAVSTESFVTYDAFDLLVHETSDALGNQVSAGERQHTLPDGTVLPEKRRNNYRVLQPELVMDPNRNCTELRFDALGMVVGSAVMGKPEENPRPGDRFTDAFHVDLTLAEIEHFLGDPDGPGAATLLAQATSRIIYDLGRFRRIGKPPFAATLARETHVSDLLQDQQTKIQVSFSYSDGFGREIQKKLQAEPSTDVFAEEVLADAPIAYYRLGEPAGATMVRDLSMNNNHSVAVEGGVRFGVPGLGTGDSAALFDGATGRIIVPNRDLLNPPRITLEAVIRWDGHTAIDRQAIVGKQSYVSVDTTIQYGLFLEPTGQVFVRFRRKISGGPKYMDATSIGVVASGVGTHVAATYDGFAICIYLNGVVDSTVPTTGDDIDTKGSQQDPQVSLTLGNLTTLPAYPVNKPFNGLIDEAVIYDRALSTERIIAHAATVKIGDSPRPRWVASGWTIYNNKGKQVRQYEPFFSATHDFEFGVTAGVSPVLFYDPAERVVATLHPNHTYEKVVFDPWQQTTYDVNDTCEARNAQTGDPRTDPDIGGYVAEYFKTQPASWQTWHAKRIDGVLGADERNAAQRAAAHADTPTTAHFDALGRPFLTVAQNRVACAGHALDGTEDRFATRVALDIEGNQRAVRDAVKHTEARDAAGNPVIVDDPLGRVVMTYDYDMLSNRIHQLSMEAGARWMLNDVTGKPIRTWDSRGHNFTNTYDALRRPVEQIVRGTTPDSDQRTMSRDILVDKIEYGEPAPTATPDQETEAQRLNLRTRIYRHFDSAGVAVNSGTNPNTSKPEAYDFKGNLLRSTRRLAKRYNEIPDWSQAPDPQLDAESFEGSTRYNALNRPIQSIAPHSSLVRAKRNIIQPVFNEANLLERVDVWLERLAEPDRPLDPKTQPPALVGVANIDYDAKGQRRRIDYKNGATTRYRYDPETFRLLHLYTRRGVAFTEDCDNPNPPPPTIAAPDNPPKDKGCGLQNLHYTYDPAGNITHIQDDAQQTIYFRNQRVEPSNDYIYDALYRLIQATGREHLGQQANGDRNPPTEPDAFNTFHTRLDHPGNGQAMGTYIERYVYDAVGNFLQMQHRGTDPTNPGWTRSYTYNEASLLEPAKHSNRLSSTQVGNGVASAPEPYEHDAHGNMTRMPHLGGGPAEPNMHWNYKDQLRQIDRGGGSTAYYGYDASGQRVRKVWEKSPRLTEERIYLGGFEIFRKHNGPIGANTATLERETLHIMDDKQRIALAETRTLDTAGDDQAPRQLIRYQFGNHLGSASLELDEQAQIISYEEYFPYGSTSYQAVRSQTETEKRYRFTGKERDEESGCDYFGARYYCPWLGRWSSPEPGGLRDGVDLFQFVVGNPIGHREIDGYGWKDFARGFAKGAVTGLVVGAAVATLPISGTALIVIGTVGVVATVASAAKTHADYASGKITAEMADERYGELGGGLVGGAAGGGAARGFKGALTTIGENARPLLAPSLIPAGPGGGFSPPQLPPPSVPVGGVSAGGQSIAVSNVIAGTGSGGLTMTMTGGPKGGGEPSSKGNQEQPASTPSTKAAPPSESGLPTALKPSATVPPSTKSPVPIIGNPQVTGPGHAEKSLETVQELAAQPDAAKAFLNKAYRTITGNPSDSLRRPDSALLSVDESITAVEVPSKTDSLLNLAARNLKAQLKLPPDKRGGVFIIHPDPKPGK